MLNTTESHLYHIGKGAWHLPSLPYSCNICCLFITYQLPRPANRIPTFFTHKQETHNCTRHRNNGSDCGRTATFLSFFLACKVIVARAPHRALQPCLATRSVHHWNNRSYLHVSDIMWVHAPCVCTLCNLQCSRHPARCVE